MKKNLLFCILFLALSELINAQIQTLWGLAPASGQYSSGTLYTINTNGAGFNVLHDFQPPDGFTPQGELLQASNGMLYGTCYNGGSFSNCTIFMFNPGNNAYTDVYDFDIVNGDFPRSGLIEGPNQMLYGAAYGGGTGCTGVLYSFNMSNNQYTKIHTFNTGCGPQGTPLLVNGTLYGMTYTGGANNKGVLYGYNIASATYTDLYDFSTASGASPQGSLIQLSNGKLYGLASEGGANNKGVIFSYEPSTDTYINLFDFGGVNGEYPASSFLQANNGLLYSVALSGGPAGAGTIFSFDASNNSFVKLDDFDLNNGAFPASVLLQAVNGFLYGTCQYGGANSKGTIFSFDITSSAITKIFDYTSASGSDANGGFITVIPTAIAENTGATPQLSIHPNPANGKITLTIHGIAKQNAEINIVNIFGQVMYTHTKASFSSNKESISIENLRPGMYFLQYIVEGNKSVAKFTKE